MRRFFMNAACLFIRFHPLEIEKNIYRSLVFAHLRNLFVFRLFVPFFLRLTMQKTVNLRDLKNFTIIFYDRLSLSGEIEHDGMCYA